MRIARSVNDDQIEAIFPYLETDAQWASFTIRDTRAKACVRIKASYPEPERARLLAAYGEEAAAADGRWSTSRRKKTGSPEGIMSARAGGTRNAWSGVYWR